MIRVPARIQKCVGFVGGRRKDGTFALFGTLFFISRPIKGATSGSIAFAVTARHVLDAIRHYGLEPCLRLTVVLKVEKDGTLFHYPPWLTFKLDDWTEHPDRSVDAAIMPMLKWTLFDVDFIHPPMTLTRDIVTEQGIGVGDEVFMAGLFANRPGADRNIPIVRVGNIAAMRDEPVYTPRFGEMDAYLIEARSIGGLSGSPVFVHLGVTRFIEGHGIVTAADPSGVFYWMGLVHGHFDSHGLTEADLVIGDAGVQRERVNMGIAIVVPADRILEIFNEPKLRELEDLVAETAAAQGVVWPAGTDPSETT